MDKDRDWLKNPILPRPPAVPHFTPAELRLLDDEAERPSSVMRVGARRGQATPLESPSRQSRQRLRKLAELDSAAPESRRIA